jgi:protease-4
MRPAALLRSIAAGLALGGAALLTPTTCAAGAPAAFMGPTRVAFLEVRGELAETPGPLAWLASSDKQRTLRDTLKLIEAAGTDGNIDALVIRLRDTQLSASKVEELSQAIGRVRKAGKQVTLYAEGMGPGELTLGAACDRVLLQSGGGVSLPGMYMEEMYLAELLSWAGVKADLVQVGDYKGANETMTRAAPSPEWDKNINALLDTLYAEMRAKLKEGRHFDDARLDDAMTHTWMALGPAAKAAGLIDDEVDLPDLKSYLGKPGGEVTWAQLPGSESQGSTLDLSNPFAMMSALFKKPGHEPTGPTIAVLHIDGPIVDGDSSGGGLLGGGSVGSRTVRNALADIENNDLIKGMVVRINSPGGSAIASEVIWRGIRRVAAHKPVYVSVGSMAASGGYYIAVAGERIFVNPSSIVGSIGVVGGKLSARQLAHSVGVNVVGRSRGPMGAMMSPFVDWTEVQRSAVRAQMTKTYELFTSRVTAGRKGIDLAKTAEGRLFAGTKAVEMKMADQVGTLDDAVSAMASAASLERGRYELMDYPGPKGLEDLLEDYLGGGGASAPLGDSGDLATVEAAGRALVGDRGWLTVRGQLNALLQLQHEPVLLTSPSVIFVR